MDYANTLLVDSALTEGEEYTDLIDNCHTLAISSVGVVLPYAQKDKTLPENTKNVSFEKVILVTNRKDAQNYPKLKKGQTTAGVITAVIYKPDFTDENVENDIRAICEKGWCDAILDLEQSPKPDGLQKKRHSLTQVEAKLMAQNNIELLVTFSAVKSAKIMPFVLNRISQLKHIVRKQNVKTHCVIYAKTQTQIANPSQTRLLLDVF